jgi:alpha-beta hydrolase superfamily lysophospholipase
MGSFSARAYVCIYGKYLDGAIISGTAYHSSFEALSGMLMCRVMARLRGWMYRSPMMTMIVMGGFNKRFEPARTKEDWLTRDEKIVDAYRADKRCHFMFTLNGYYGMFRVLKLLTEQRRLARMPVHLPLFFIAGEMDPVGNFGDGVKRVVVQLRTLGADRIECRLYPNDRHEVLNELNRSEVYKDVLEWLEKVMPRK